jgi:hypothetical protein
MNISDELDTSSKDSLISEDFAHALSNLSYHNELDEFRNSNTGCR